MKIEKNPFSIYDFLGYFIPGAFFVYGLVFILSIINRNTTNLLDIKLDIDQYLIAIIICYIIGHITSYLSSITVEVFSVWSLGYPSKYLLNYEFRGFWRNLFKDKNILRNFVRVLMCLFIYPVLLTDLLVRNIFKIRQVLGKPLDEMTISIITKKIEQFTKEKMSISEEHLPLHTGDKDFFRFLYHYSMEKCPAHNIKLDNYVALYGFTRTLCFNMIVMSWIVLIITLSNSFQKSSIIIIAILVMLSGIFYLDFNKFYRKFSVEAFMAFTTIES
jgi:hypothetical protein